SIPVSEELGGNICPSLGAHHALGDDTRCLGPEQNSMSNAGEMDQHFHSIVDEVRNLQTFADGPLVLAFSSEVKSAFVEPQRGHPGEPASSRTTTPRLTTIATCWSAPMS